MVFFSVAPQNVRRHVRGLNAAVSSRIYELDAPLDAEKALNAKARGFNFGKPLNVSVEFDLSGNCIGDGLASMA